jgi:hypothetical protein
VARQLGFIVLFSLPAVALWWRAWTGGAASTVRCSCLDPGQQVWFVAWPAFALHHGLNLFATTWLWPTHGVNLLANASSPLVGTVLAPVTWIFGPFVATTVALTLAPGLSAWGCFVACRRLVAWAPAAWIAGFLFGYSPFVIENVDQGHLGLALLLFPSLILVVLHEILVRRQWAARWSGVALGLLLFAQFLVSQEILLLTVLMALVGIVISAVLSPRQVVTSLSYALRAFAVAGLVAVVTLGWPAWYMLRGPQHIRGSIWNGLQVLFTSEAYQIWDAGHPTQQLTDFPAHTGIGPPAQFLGITVLIVAAAALVLAWRRRAAWVLAVVAVAATIFSWGSAIYLSSTHANFYKWLPWQWVTNWAVLDNIESLHFVALADLAVAIVIAVGIGAVASWSLWHDMPVLIRGVALAVLSAVVALMVVPIWTSYHSPLTVEKVVLPPWYTTAARAVPAGSVVLSYPFPASAAGESQPMVWQAADGMRFRLAGGYVKVPGPGKGVIGLGPVGSSTWTLDVLTMAYGDLKARFHLTGGEVTQLRSALRQWDVRYIVVSDTGAAPVEAAAVFTAVTGTVPVVSHRSWVWDVQGLPLPSNPAAGAATAAATFETCRSQTKVLGVVSAHGPLPQTFNTCVAAGSAP